jgi:hypothetical protein
VNPTPAYNPATHNPDGTPRAANPAAVAGENANPNVPRTDPANTNPTGREYHAPHDAGHPRQGAITRNPPSSPGLLNQEPRFGNLSADGVTTTDGRAVAPGGVRNPDGSISNAVRNPDGSISQHGTQPGAHAVGTVGAPADAPAGGTLHNRAATDARDGIVRNPDGSVSNAAAAGTVSNATGTVQNPAAAVPGNVPVGPVNADGSYRTTDGVMHNKDGTVRK